MYNKIGIMLMKLRESAGISQKSLALGILSVTELSRFESGKREMDYMHMEALFQRIGKSTDKLELAMPIEEYRLLELRHNLLSRFLNGNTAEADEKIKEYDSYIDRRRPLHLQAVLTLQALKSYIENKNDKAVLQLFEKALEVTFPDWKEADYGNICLCTQEIRLILAILYIQLNISAALPCCRVDVPSLEEGALTNLSDEKRQSLGILQKIYNYIDTRYTDEEERTRVYPQCAWMWSRICLMHKNISMAYEICQKGVDCLAQNGVVTIMKELLAVKAECLEQLGVVEEAQKAERHKEALEFIYNIADKPYMPETIVQFFVTSIQGEVVVTNELIHEMRVGRKMSQEELSADICTQETLSRIEGGKHSPNTKKLYQMFKKLGLERERYYSYIVADDYELYEKVRLYQRCIGKKERENAALIFGELEEKLDYKYIVNKQFIATVKIIFELDNKKLSYECGYEKLKNILKYSMKDYDGEIHRIPFRQEVVILNQMAKCLRRCKKYDDAIMMHQQILDRYDDSIVSNVFHSAPAMLVYINYTGLLEYTNHLSEAEKIGKEGIRLMLDCQRGDVSGMILANLTCVYEKGNTQKDAELAKSCLKNSFYLLDLYLHEYNKAILKEAYERLYKELLA